MIKELIYIIEILSVLKCIHCVYGERQKINAGWIMTCLLVFLSILGANKYGFALEGTFMMYLILTIYCIITFHRPFKEIVINTAIYLSIGALIQLITLCIVMLYMRNDILVNTLIADILSLIVCYVVIPLVKLDRFSRWLLKKNIFSYLAIIYIFLLILNLSINMKRNGGTKIGLYLMIIPFIVCIYLITKQWGMYQSLYDQRTKELHLYEKDRQKLSGLIANVRSRQHEINNHIAAIMAMRYTEKSYEEYVNAQNDYCEHILKDNKYNSLLCLYNSVLPGFLLDKFRYIEEKGISVECKICVNDYAPDISEYYLIEMLGVLLDNATDAVCDSDAREVMCEIMEVKTGFCFMVRNPHSYVPYDEIESWFDYGKSSKGKERGIGLYHLKCLCDEWKCPIIVQNVEYNHKNYIEFKIETGRKVCT